MKFHPYSEVFPLLEGKDFDELVADIKAHGLREKIVLYQGKVLDGRNRFLACQKAKVRPLKREFKGSDADALAFVVSANVARRHLTENQRAMAAARIATLRKGGDPNASREALTQGEAAEQMDVSRSSVQRARKVVEQGSKALQHAVDSGEVPLTRAASVVDLPKAEQLSAAKKSPEKEPEPQLPPEAADNWEPEIDEDEKLALAEKDYLESAERAMGKDALSEIKRLTDELAGLKLARDGYMRGKDAITKLLRAEQRKSAKLQKRVKELESDCEGLRERISIMEAA